MKRSEDYDVRFGRLCARVEKWLVALIVLFGCCLLAIQGLIHPFEPIRSMLVDTDRWEGTTQLRQK